MVFAARMQGTRSTCTSVLAAEAVMVIVRVEEHTIAAAKHRVEKNMSHI